MIFDAALQMSSKQAVSATSYSTDTAEIVPGLNAGVDMACQIVVHSESGTLPTLTVELETSSDNSTFTKLVGHPKPAGFKIFSIDLGGISGLKKYLRMRYVVGGTTPSYSVSAFLVPGDGFSSRAVGDLRARSQV